MNEHSVLKWMKENNAPFAVRLEVLKAFQLYKLLEELDRKLMEKEIEVVELQKRL